MRAALLLQRLFAVWLALPETCLPPAELRMWRPSTHAPASRTLSYPTDEDVARILRALRGAALFEVSALPAMVDLPREDLKSGIAALCIEGLVTITEAVRRPGLLARPALRCSAHTRTLAPTASRHAGRPTCASWKVGRSPVRPGYPRKSSRETPPLVAARGHHHHRRTRTNTRRRRYYAVTTIYYSGPAELAAPPLPTTGPLEPAAGASGHNESIRRVLWRCASHHLIDRSAPGGAPRVLLCDPAAEIERHDADPRHPHEAAVGLRLSLSSMAQELCSHLRESTHPRFGGRAALVVNEPQLLSGAHANRQTLLLCASLAAYVRWAPTLGVACYVAAADPRTLAKDLRRALEEEASVWRPAAAPRVAVVPRMPTARARGGAAPVQPPARRRTA